MKIPRTLKICGHVVKVRIVKNIKGQMAGSLGYADLNHNEIVLRKEYEGKPLEESMRAEVFLHETIHMIGQIYGIPLNEKTVRQTSGALFQVIRDNRLDFIKVV
jgi:hypothetical protein